MIDAHSIMQTTTSLQLVYFNGYLLQQEVEGFPLVQDINTLWKRELLQIHPPSHRTSIQ